MSCVLTAYIVNFADLKSLMGGNDNSIVSAVDLRISEAYEDDEGEIKSQKSALRKIIRGDSLNPKEASLYTRVLWQICRVKGEELLPDIWGGVRWDAVVVCGLEELLTKSQSPLGLPISRDIPYVGYIGRDGILGYVNAAETTMSTSGDSDVVELLEEFVEWLQIGVSRQKDMVIFYG